jgi:uncharacterized OB-fold protein
LAALYTWTVVHQALHPAFSSEVPYALLVVEMDEGPRLVSRLSGGPLERLTLGMRLRVEFRAVDDDVVLPWFRPVWVGSGHDHLHHAPRYQR